MIRQLAQSGNFAAKEYCEHLDAIQESIEHVYRQTSVQEHAHVATSVNDDTGLLSSIYTMTAGMALAEPSMQEFLAETDLAISGIDDTCFDPLQIPHWPVIWGGDDLSTA